MTATSGKELVLGSFEGKVFERYPIWFMRQAGRYLPEYMEIREEYTFEERSQTPELAAKITLQPIHRYDLDAAIIFSDILIPLYYMDRGLSIKPGVGPRLDDPLTDPAKVEDLPIPIAKEDFPYIEESIKLTKKELGDKAMIGFSGAPFTLASYLIEGKSTKNALLTKSFAYQNPTEFFNLLEKLTDIIIDQLHSQIRGGADLIQVFDSWAGFLSKEQFNIWSKPYLTRIFRELSDIPSIFFSKGSYHLLDQALQIENVDGFSVDTTIEISKASDLVGNKLLQGNFDPAYLLTNPALVENEVNKLLRTVDNTGRDKYIFNLGTGINKNATVENVEAMVKTVKSFRREQ